MLCLVFLTSWLFWQVDFLVSWLFGGWPFLLVSIIYLLTSTHFSIEILAYCNTRRNGQLPWSQLTKQLTHQKSNYQLTKKSTWQKVITKIKWPLSIWLFWQVDHFSYDHKLWMISFSHCCYGSWMPAYVDSREPFTVCSLDK